LTAWNTYNNIKNIRMIEENIITYTLKMLGCFNPILGQIWTNPAIGLHF